jgi:predicted RNA polymerase sigma factor
MASISIEKQRINKHIAHRASILNRLKNRLKNVKALQAIYNNGHNDSIDMNALRAKICCSVAK